MDYSVRGSGSKNHMSLKELKKNIREALEKSGALDSVKAQIRREFVESFKETAALTKKKRDYRLWDRILLSIIYHHFKHVHLEHTLSVFLAESGFDSSSLIDVVDIPLSLNIGQESKLYREIIRTVAMTENVVEYENAEPSKSILEILLNESHTKSRKYSIETSCQTDVTGPGVRETLDQQIRELHISYTTRRETERLVPNKTIEERMIVFQRECEDRIRKEYESQLFQMKNVEIGRIKSEEAEKKRVEIEHARKELEHDYRQRLQAHMDREAESSRVAADKARQNSLMEYESRQRVQRELDDLRAREESSRRKIELETKAISMQETRLKELQTAVESREREISRKEKEFAIKTNELTAQVREEASRKMEREMDSILREKATLMLERKRFEDERDSDLSRQAAMSEMKKKFREMQEELDSKDDEISKLNGAFERLKNSIGAENSSAAKLLEEYGFQQADIQDSMPSTKLDSMVLLIKRNAELEAKNNQLSMQLASAHSELERAANKRENLSDTLSTCKKELETISSRSGEKDSEIAKLHDENGKLRIILSNARRARQSMTEECKELEQLVSEQRSIISQLRKAQAREASYASQRDLHQSSYSYGKQKFAPQPGGYHIDIPAIRSDVETVHESKSLTRVSHDSSRGASSLRNAEVPQQVYDPRVSTSQPSREEITRQLPEPVYSERPAAHHRFDALSGGSEENKLQLPREKYDHNLSLSTHSYPHTSHDDFYKSNEIRQLPLRHAVEDQAQFQSLERATGHRELEYAKHTEPARMEQESRPGGRAEVGLDVTEKRMSAEELRGLKERHERAGSMSSKGLDNVASGHEERKVEEESRRREEQDKEKQAREKEEYRELEQRKEEDRRREEERERQARLEAQRVEESRRLQEEEDRKRREEQRRLEEEEARRRQQQQQQEEDQRKEEESERQAREREEQRRLEEEEARRRQQQQEEEDQRKEEESERRRQQQQEEEDQRKEEESERRRLQQEEEDRLRREEEEEERRKLQVEEARRREEDQRQREEEEEEQRRLQEEELRKKKEKEEEEQKKKDDEAALQSARARVLERRRQQKMRQSAEEPESLVHKEPQSNAPTQPTSPIQALSDTEVQSFNGSDSSDYDWS